MTVVQQLGWALRLQSREGYGPIGAASSAGEQMLRLAR